MEAGETSLNDSSAVKSKSVTDLKEKKKRLKAIYRKRHHANLSFRNTTLNSTMFKASLKINNRALAQALERKKGELRAAEAIILKLKEENQLLTSQINQEKLITEKTKEEFHGRLCAVSSTLQLAVGQLVDAMHSCTSSEFRKLSDAFVQATTLGHVAASSEAEQVPVPCVIEHRTAAPSRVLVSSSSEDVVVQNDGDDDLDIDNDNESQDVATSFDPVQMALPPNGTVPASNLSVIVEQSYLFSGDAELSALIQEQGSRHSNSQDRRNQVIFQPSVVDSPVLDEDSSKNPNVGLRRSSRSRHVSGRESDRKSASDVIVRRSRSQDRRNTMIFKPSPAADSPQRNEADLDRTEGVTLHRSGNRSKPQCLDSSSKKSASGLDDSLRLSLGREQETKLQDETLVDDTVAMTSDLVEQLCIYKDLLKNGEIVGEQSLQLVEETILSSPGSNARQIANSLSHSGTAVCLSVSATDQSLLSAAKDAVGSVEVDGEGMVVKGQFVTRDKIARTPIKKSTRSSQGESDCSEVTLPLRRSVGLSDTFSLDLNDSESNRSLSRRDIPTFLPIEDSPGTRSSPAKMKAGVLGKNVQARHRDSLKRTLNARLSSKTLGEMPGSCKNGKTVKHRTSGSESDLCTAAKTGATGKKAVENVRLSRRGTFTVSGKNVAPAEDDITKEDDTVLINNSYEDSAAEMDGNIIPTHENCSADTQCPRKEEGNPLNTLGEKSNDLLQEGRSNDLMEKNVTILMFEDMEQTRVNFASILLPASDDAMQHLAKDSTNKAQMMIPADGKDDIVGDDDVFLEKDADSNALDSHCGIELTAPESTGKDLGCLSNTVKRRKINTAKLKLPAACKAVKESKIKSALQKSEAAFDEAIKALALDAGDVQTVGRQCSDDFAEPQNQTLDAEARKRFAAFVSKPGNIVFNADRKDLADSAGGEVSKKARSKPRSLLPLQQKPRSKMSAAAAAKPEEGGPTVWDFKGTPRQAATKDGTERLLSVYDISLNDSSVIPKPKDTVVKPSHPKSKSKAGREFSKDDSFIVDKPNKISRRRRHESTSGIENMHEEINELLESPHGILLALGRKRKPSARSKTVRLNIDDPGKGEVRPLGGEVSAGSKNDDPNFKKNVVKEFGPSGDTCFRKDCEPHVSGLGDVAKSLEPRLKPGSVKEPKSIGTDSNVESNIHQISDSVPNSAGFVKSVNKKQPSLGSSNEEFPNKRNAFLNDKKDAKAKNSVVNSMDSAAIRSDRQSDISKKKKIVSTKNSHAGKDLAKSTKRGDCPDLDVVRESAHGKSRKDVVDSQDREPGGVIDTSLPEIARTETNERIVQDLPTRQKEATACDGSYEEAVIEKRPRKRRAAQSTNLFEDEETSSTHGSKAKLLVRAEQQTPSLVKSSSTEEVAKTGPEDDSSAKSTTNTNRKALPEMPPPAKTGAPNSRRLPKSVKAETPKLDPAVTNSSDAVSDHEKYLKTNSTQKEPDTRRRSSDKSLLPTASNIQEDSSAKTSRPKSHQAAESQSSNLPSSSDALTGFNVNSKRASDTKNNEEKTKKRSTAKSRISAVSDASDASPHPDRRSRRAASNAVSYKEPSVNKKLRRGDPFTSNIYDESNPESLKPHGHEKAADAKRHRKALSTVENV